jgi:anti-anti-sigma factor
LLEYVNSAGLRALLSALKDCKKAGGNVVLTHVQPRVADTLQLVGFQTLFEQYPDVLDAVDSF